MNYRITNNLPDFYVYGNGILQKIKEEFDKYKEVEVEYKGEYKAISEIREVRDTVDIILSSNEKLRYSLQFTDIPLQECMDGKAEFYGFLVYWIIRNDTKKPIWVGSSVNSLKATFNDHRQNCYSENMDSDLYNKIRGKESEFTVQILNRVAKKSDLGKEVAYWQSLIEE